MNSPAPTKPPLSAAAGATSARQGIVALLQRLARKLKPLQPRRVLFLDDDPSRAQAFLAENPQAVWVQTVDECLACMTETWDEIHLDHDLGGRQYVDVNQIDCGMEVIRWMCKEPRPHLNSTSFFVHTHNSMAGLLMVLQMRARGYKAEFRPFGFDVATLLAHNDPAAHSQEQVPGRTAAVRSPWLRWLSPAGAWLRAIRARSPLVNGQTGRPGSPDRK